MRRHLLMVVAAGLLVAADDAKTQAPADQGKLQGTWEVVSMERGGMKREGPPEAQLVFEGDKFTMKMGERSIRGTFKLDPAKAPGQIDMTVTEGPEQFQGKTSQGLYALEGDTLKWCSAEPGTDDRPKEFKTAEGTTHMLIVLKKKK
jgi:uncharacterized protein (TIGR03067 family)